VDNHQKKPQPPTSSTPWKLRKKAKTCYASIVIAKTTKLVKCHNTFKKINCAFCVLLLSAPKLAKSAYVKHVSNGECYIMVPAFPGSHEY